MSVSCSEFKCWLGSALALMLLSAPAVLGREAGFTEPFFSVSSNQTYAPSQQAKVFVRFRQVDHLDFRVYRVKDPFKFFANLRDAHSLGSEKRELARAKTLLERYHEWKRDLRLTILDFFREQLRWETRVARHAVLVQKQKVKRIPLDITAYAQVPLLNREQLVVAWRELLPRTRGVEYQEIPVDLHRKGLFLVEVAYRELRAYTLLMVTDLALVSKSSPGQVLLFLVNRESGAPVEGATTVIFNRRQELARGVTDSSGVSQATFPDIKIENAMMVAKTEQDVAATGIESFFFYDTSSTEYVGSIYTDRPVYRPTHEVNFKGILRARRGGRLSLDVPGPVTVEINDPNQKTIYRQKLNLSSFGSFNGRATLGALSALGVYGIVAHIGDKAVYGSFEVQDYQKPEFEVAVTTDKARYLQGETIQATITARYYFGAPVANGKVKYSVYKSRYYFPYWRILWGGEYAEEEPWEGEGEGKYEGEEYGYAGQEISQGSGQLDAQGVLKVALPTEIDPKKRDSTYRIEAHVTDASNREIVGGHSALATYSTIVVLFSTDRYVYRPGERAQIAVHTLDYESQPVSADVHLSFAERRGWGSQAVRVELHATNVRTDSKGIARYEYTIPSIQSIEVRATTTDPNGREAEYTSGLWVSGAYARGPGVVYQRMEIYPDKHSYKPGETARVLIVTNTPRAHVLVTTEGQKVYTWSVHRAEATSLTVEIPIEERYEPNLFIGVSLVKKEQLLQTTKSVSVPAAEKILKVTVETDKEKYRPNDKVSYTIRTADAKGAPVSAEVSLGVVDEAIYAIRPDAVPPPEKIFYARIWNRVHTQYSAYYWFVGYSGMQRMELTWLRPPTTLADFKGAGQLVQPKVRKYFPDTIAWMPAIVTDASGVARASFNFPDSLTTWRATVRAVSRNTLVGQVTRKVITRKDLILRLEIPRFLTQGDTVTVTGIVHNYLENEKTARVSLEVQGVELQGAAETSVTVPKNGEAAVTWTVRAPKIGQANFLAKALTDEESDALEVAVPVRPWGLELNAALSGAIPAEKADSTEKLFLPADINPDASTVRLDFSPSLAGTLISALDFLSRYPYGCVEQTMSSFLPSILVLKAVKELGFKPPPASVELDKKIAAGLERLYRFQHEDGGWGWWETDQTHPFMTAYVVAGLEQAKEAGYSIDEKRLKQARGSLLKQIQSNPQALADLRAYLLYAYALGSDFDRNLLEELYASREKFSPHGQALMALLLARMKDPRAAELAKALEQRARVEGPHAWWKSERQEMLDFSSDNSFETTAYALKALTALDPKSDLLPKAARWLVDRRTEGYYWTSTEQTAMAIYGLIDFLKVSRELNPNYTIAVYLNGQKLAERRVTEKDVASPEPFVVTARAPEVHPGSNEVRLVKDGPGVLYWSAFATYYSREPKPAPVGGTALNVVRVYSKLAPEKLADRFVYTEQPLEGTVQSGDVVVVRLTVSATAEEQYLEIEDPIPAGFEFVELENLYELKSRPPWWDFYYTRREFHDDRAALFSTTFARGQGQFHYLLKAVSPGNFQANPARVLPMYEPSRQASTRSFSISVTPR